jgi:hypothetical protein
VDMTNREALAAVENIAGIASPTAVAAIDLRSLSVRELLGELAATENVLREHPDESVHRSTVRRQVLLVGELRRRRRRQGRERALRRPLVVADRRARGEG